MKHSILLLTLLSTLGLVACEKTTVDKTPETIIVPVPIAGPAGAAGEAGEKGATGQSGDEGIQGEPGKPSGDTVIIIPPPEVNMPAEIVPEPSSVTPAN